MSRRRKHRRSGNIQPTFGIPQTNTAVQPPSIPAPSSMAQVLLGRVREMGMLSVGSSTTKLEVPSIVRAGPTKDGGVTPVLTVTPPAGRSIESLTAEAVKSGTFNQQVYLAKAQTSGQPWFHHPHQNHQYSEYVVVNEQMARTLLQYNPNVRKLQPMTAEVYSRDMESGNWLITSEAIDVDVAGNMSDGQTRMAALVMANERIKAENEAGINTPPKEPVSIPFWFAFNVAVESKLVRDSGRRRTTNDKMRLVLGTSVSAHFAAICRAMMRGVNHNNQRYSETEMAEFAMTHENAVRWAIDNMPKQRTDVQAAIAKAYLLHGEERIKPFCEPFESINFADKTAANLALYKWVKDASQKPSIEVYRKTVNAINRFMANLPTERLYEAREDIFAWQMPGWVVPNRPE